MRESIPLGTANTKKRNLILRFCLTATIVTSILVLLITALFFLQQRAAAIAADVHTSMVVIDQRIARLSALAKEGPAQGIKPEFWQFLQAHIAPKTLTVFTAEQKILWPANADNKLISEQETAAFQRLLSGADRLMITDQNWRPHASLQSAFGSDSSSVISFVKLTDVAGNAPLVLRLVGNLKPVLTAVEQSTKRVFWSVLAANGLLFLALFYNFQRGLRTIELQEKTLNQQISRLSNLLDINKGMQKSMKTASSRAVEMNEQFLRRVGSDLHDGPAQSLGYAMMRLNRISEDPQAKGLSHEFHVVKETLETSLAEIRGISAGLVLPELEHLTLQEALHRVVQRHAKNSASEVTEYYTDLPQEVALPIKITAYRFVQEGLNNAHRHGQAERCRITAHVKSGVLHLSLKDNGMGFRKSQLSTDGGHLGLMGLKDRVESLGGRFSINSELGVGTAIKVSLVLDDETITS